MTIVRAKGTFEFSPKAGEKRGHEAAAGDDGPGDERERGTEAGVEDDVSDEELQRRRVAAYKPPDPTHWDLPDTHKKWDDELAALIADKTPPPHTEAAWEWWRGMGEPRYMVAPMVDASELPFRQLCRKHGATAAYSPMFHARLFAESAPYRAEQFSTCEADRPLFVQFCANDPPTLVRAAKLVEGQCDAVDLNLGCPQRIAKRGRYGAFLMEDIDLVESLVRALHKEISTPVTVKIRCFPDVRETIKYARRLEKAGAYLVAVHGRTREQKRAAEVAADWEQIRAVKAALSVPVCANGNVRCVEDADRLMKFTGADSCMSAESLLRNPAMFGQRREGGGESWQPPASATPAANCADLLLEYLDEVENHPVQMRMIKGHVHQLLGDWLQEFTDLRDVVNGANGAGPPTVARLRDMAVDIRERIRAAGRPYPVPRLSWRAIKRIRLEAARQAAQEAQEKEEAEVAALDARAVDPPAPGT